MCRERILVQNSGITSKACQRSNCAIHDTRTPADLPLFPAAMGQLVVDDLAAWFAGKALLIEGITETEDDRERMHARLEG
jgi:hypothetical protein